MKCRNYANNTIVWFGSRGKDANGHKLPAKNYANDGEAVTSSLTQKLSVIKGELWTDINYGLPLFEKNRSRAIMNSFVIKRITSHPEVKKLISFESTLKEHHYSCSCKILTKYGELDMSI